MFFQQLFNGITIGATYSLVAVGFSIVYSVLELVNFAHGSFYVMAGYLVLCALVAVYQHKKCRERRDQYLRYLHRLNKSYLAEEKAREDA